MRLLFLSNFYPPYEIGGYEQWCEEVAVGLKARGHEVFVLTSRYGVQSGTVEISGEVDRVLFLETDNDYYRPLDFFLRHSSQEASNINELRRKIDEVQPDFVMVWGMWNLSHFLPFWAEQWLPGRVAYFISNYWPADKDLHRSYWELPARRAAAGVVKRPLRALALSQLKREGYPPTLAFDHAVCCSEYVRQTLIDAGKLPEHAGVLLGGTDPKQFLAHSRLNQIGADEETGLLKLLYFGRLIHDKGIHTAIEAIGSLKQQGLADNIELTVLGSGHPEYEAYLHKLVDELGIKEQVHFVNQVPRSKVPEWLGRFDVFLFTSIWPEPMARSVMEAMAAGLLVIGTEVGGQTEMLIDEQNALTFQAEDTEKLAAHIVRIANNPSLRTTLAAAGQQMILEKFTLERMVEDIEQFLVNLTVSNAIPNS
ncbi:MAG: glycosyltransferase family 4 protein [Anaerolineae bacterium]|nr:glycosyltransferase family 4 protein [Anaerolineae bacterium]